jgi:pyruvate/2-oxoglutarate dehydrogenase complex dihydrolipoamide dehydrogenase (E3) component
MDKKGVIVDARLRTQNKRIYAIGDCAGGAQFTHLAGDHAGTVIRNIFFKVPARRRDALNPRVTFTDPELASVGMNESEATAAGGKSVAFAFDKNDRAVTERRTEGLAKAMVDKKGRVVGAVVVGRGAGDLILTCQLAVARRLPIRAFADVIAPYPTRSEVLKRAASAYYAPVLYSERTKQLVRLLTLFD